MQGFVYSKMMSTSIPKCQSRIIFATKMHMAFEVSTASGESITMFVSHRTSLYNLNLSCVCIAESGERVFTQELNKMRCR
jgi:hypothetical protein